MTSREMEKVLAFESRVESTSGLKLTEQMEYFGSAEIDEYLMLRGQAIDALSEMQPEVKKIIRMMQVRMLPSRECFEPQ